MRPIVKIILGIILIAGGLYGAKLIQEGVHEIGVLGQYRLGDPTLEQIKNAK